MLKKSKERRLLILLGLLGGDMCLGWVTNIEVAKDENIRGVGKEISEKVQERASSVWRLVLTDKEIVRGRITLKAFWLSFVWILCNLKSMKGLTGLQDKIELHKHFTQIRDAPVQELFSISEGVTKFMFVVRYQFMQCLISLQKPDRNWQVRSTISDVVLKISLGLKTIFFEVLVLTLDGLKDLKICGLKIKKVLRPQFLDQKVLRPVFRPKRSSNPNFGRIQISVLKILILDEAKLNKKAGNNQVFFGYRHDWAKLAWFFLSGKFFEVLGKGVARGLGPPPNQNVVSDF